VAAPLDEPSRPTGIGLTAVLLCALVVIVFLDGLFSPELSGSVLADHFRSERLPSLFSGGALLAIQLFTIWSYWKRKDWARALVLIASFWIAAREVSTSIENGGSLIVVMSHPVLFFEFALAIFLLYWLNTRPLRAWFKNAPPTTTDLIASNLTGKLCTAIAKNQVGPNQGWHLAFEHDAELILNCHWRVVMDDNLAFASDFSISIFSNPAGSPGPEIPIDEELPRQLLQNLRVTAVRVTPRTSDLFVTFEMGLELQTWSSDSHAEQWRFSDPILTVTADSAGLDSQVMTARISTEDSAAND
jgi:hypothetical protein